MGGIPKWPKGADCKSVGSAFEGSNPSPSIPHPLCRSGGTGRRTGLKILRSYKDRTGSIPVSGIIAQIAQSVEQRTENPRVGGSIPPLGTIINIYAGVVQW